MDDVSHHQNMLPLAGDPVKAVSRRGIGGISEKMLIQTLKRLEGAGLVTRFAYPEVPPRVEYSLTERGRSLSPLIVAFDEWIEDHSLEMV